MNEIPYILFEVKAYADAYLWTQNFKVPNWGWLWSDTHSCLTGESSEQPTGLVALDLLVLGTFDAETSHLADQLDQLPQDSISEWTYSYWNTSNKVEDCSSQDRQTNLPYFQVFVAEREEIEYFLNGEGEKMPAVAWHQYKSLKLLDVWPLKDSDLVAIIARVTKHYSNHFVQNFLR